MSDLISRSEAKKLGATCLARRNENGQLEAIISLDNAPTIELNESVIQEVLNKRCMTAVANEYLIALHGNSKKPQGEWIEKVETKQFGHGWLTTHETVCSVCGGSGESDEGIPQCWKFCPHCGADMRGEE